MALRHATYPGNADASDPPRSRLRLRCVYGAHARGLVQTRGRIAEFFLSVSRLFAPPQQSGGACRTTAYAIAGIAIASRSVREEPATAVKTAA